MLLNKVSINDSNERDEEHPCDQAANECEHYNRDLVALLIKIYAVSVKNALFIGLSVSIVLLL